MVKTNVTMFSNALDTAILHLKRNYISPAFCSSMVLRHYLNSHKREPETQVMYNIRRNFIGGSFLINLVLKFSIIIL